VAAAGERRLAAHPLAHVQRALEQPVQHRARGARRRRVEVRVAELAEELRVAEHLRLDAGGHAQQVPHRPVAGAPAGGGEQVARGRVVAHPRAGEPAYAASSARAPPAAAGAQAYTSLRLQVATATQSAGGRPAASAPTADAGARRAGGRRGRARRRARPGAPP
jgi:hypothetical protein